MSKQKAVESTQNTKPKGKKELRADANFIIHADSALKGIEKWIANNEKK